MKLQRGAGLLHHITSLPSRFGIGDLGPEAYAFADLLAAAGQKYWQILPLGQTGYGNSPYGCFSAFAGNVWMISPEKLAESGFLSEDELEDVPEFPADRVDFGGTIEWKRGKLRAAFENFRNTTDEDVAADFHRFCDENAWWLEDYAFYQAYRDANGYAAWFEWDDAVKDREPIAIESEKAALDDDMFAQKFYQFAFFSQWNELKAHINELGIAVIGDVPIYVAHDSCDVWANRRLFKLNEDGTAAFVSGVPPDHFSKTGQLWGNPIFDWDTMRGDGFHWWTERVRSNLQLFDILRIDHFIGFARAWEVPGDEKTAKNGEWRDVPGKELFAALRRGLGEMPLLAEDLGEVTAEVEQLRDEYEISGMRVLQFAFGGDAYNTHLPHNYISRSVVYTGTHDNDTAIGWFKLRKRKKRGQPHEWTYLHCMEYLRSDGKRFNWDMIRAAYASVSDIAIIPTQDVLGLDNRSRMNRPASAGDNWSWRMKPDALKSAAVDELKKLAEFYAR